MWGSKCSKAAAQDSSACFEEIEKDGDVNECNERDGGNGNWSGKVGNKRGCGLDGAVGQRVSVFAWGTARVCDSTD